MLSTDETLVTVVPLNDISGPAELTVVDGIVLVPTGHVLLMSVHLPLSSANRRREALPFALEEHVSQPLEAVHFALGMAVGPNQYLAAAVDKDRMRSWIAQLGNMNLANARLVPDALTLPMPGAGHCSVHAIAGRALVRLDDGTGFEAPLDQLPFFWARAGRPAILASGELPADMPLAGQLLLAPLSERARQAPLDLRQGQFAPERPALSRHWRRAAVITACGLAAHAAITAADTFALVGMVNERKAETEALVSIARPGAYLADDLIETATEILPAGGARPAVFLPLLSNAAGALMPLGDAIRFENLAYSEADDTLKLAVAATDAVTLSRADAALRQRGLRVRSSPPASTESGVRGDILVQAASK